MRLQTADIEWRDDLPFSRKFGDIYFQVDDGFAESNYVFLEANKLRERLLDTDDDTDTVVIAETGFGSGLNFIACCSLWKSLPSPKKRIEFISIEAFPLAKEDLVRVAAKFGNLTENYTQLIEQYPEPVKGSHLLRFENENIRLRLLFDCLEDVLENYTIRPDIWFLDGFSPKANEAMWTEKLFQYIGSNALPGSSISTFTAAGFIKRGLLTAGFEVNKIAGFGRKREMITAFYPTNGKAGNRMTPNQPWHLSKPKTNKRKKAGSRIIVVGAGIAGLVQTLTLVRQGFEVTLIDKGDKPLSGASSQPQLIMYAKYPKQMNAEGQLLFHAHSVAQRYYQHEQAKSKISFWHPIGLTQLAWNNDEAEKQNTFIRNYDLPKSHVKKLSAEELTLLSGISLQHPGLYFEDSGWLDTHKFSNYVLNLNGVEFFGDIQAHGIKKDSDGTWSLETSKGSMTADNIVICAAYGVRELLSELQLPLKLLRGQTTQIVNNSLSSLNCVLCGEGYLSPSLSNTKELHLGATYDLGNTDGCYKEEDNLKNLEQLEKWLPDSSILDAKSIVTGGKAGLRTTSSDYTPIAGPVPDMPAMAREFSGLKQNAKACRESYGSYLKGLYVNVGYGSKGLTFAPVCADLISSHIKATPCGQTHTMQKMLSPARFLIRKLKKGLDTTNTSQNTKKQTP